MKKLYCTLNNAAKEYKRKNKKPLEFDFYGKSKHLWKLQSNKGLRYFHYFHYYPGRIYPFIPLYILSLDDFSHLDGYVMDPFAGSGTILLESIINPVKGRNALGVEINPLGRLISKVKTTPLDCEQIEKFLTELHKEYIQLSVEKITIPKFKNINLWFSKKAINGLAKLKYSIEMLDAPFDYKDFFWVCFSSIIRKVSKADPYIPPPVLLKLDKYICNSYKFRKLAAFLSQTEKPNVWALFVKAVKSNSEKLAMLNSFENFASQKFKAEIIWNDARCIKRGKILERGRLDKNSTEEFPSKSVDIIFTSPPYLTAQKYIRTNRLELLWLGFSEEEVNYLDKVSIGTERVASKETISNLNITSIDLLINYAFNKSRKRGLMVYKYFRDMLLALKEMYRVLKNGGYAILVVGDNKVLGKKVKTYRLLADAAIEVGFREIVIFKDKIRKRSMLTKRNSTGGLIKNEYVIILKKEE